MSKPAPVIRATSEEIESIYELYAAKTALSRAGREMERRARSIPNGWRDLRQVTGTLARLVDRIMQTVPVEKQAAIYRMLPNCHFRVIKGIEACNLSPDEIVLNQSEFDAIAKAAHQQCKLCDRQNCKQCTLGRTFDRVLTHDRDGRSWASIDM